MPSLFVFTGQAILGSGGVGRAVCGRLAEHPAEGRRRLPRKDAREKQAVAVRREREAAFRP